MPLQMIKRRKISKKYILMSLQTPINISLSQYLTNIHAMRLEKKTYLLNEYSEIVCGHRKLFLLFCLK